MELSCVLRPWTWTASLACWQWSRIFTIGPHGSFAWIQPRRCGAAITSRPTQTRCVRHSIQRWLAQQQTTTCSHQMQFRNTMMLLGHGGEVGACGTLIVEEALAAHPATRHCLECCNLKDPHLWNPLSHCCWLSQHSSMRMRRRIRRWTEFDVCIWNVLVID